MTIKIEKGVPLIARRHGPQAPGKYPFKDMEVGDSFAVLLAESKCPDLRHLQQSLTSAGRRTLGNGKVTVRRLDDGTGVRVWRIAQ